MITTKRKLRRSSWNTYAIRGYTHDIANDQRSAGGVHCYQVRQTKGGFWQQRILQTNGNYEAAGPVAEDGEALFATANQR